MNIQSFVERDSFITMYVHAYLSTDHMLINTCWCKRFRNNTRMNIIDIQFYCLVISQTFLKVFLFVGSSDKMLHSISMHFL